jgi:hypothetical protein
MYMPVSTESDSDKPENKKQRLALEKAIDKDLQLEQDTKILYTSYNPIRHQTQHQMTFTDEEGNEDKKGNRKDWPDIRT